MKIAGISGRGIEGCGQTKYMIELKSCMEKAGHTLDIFSSTDKKFGRRNAQSISVKEDCSFADDENIKRIAQDIKDNYDVAILFSVPAKNYPEKAISNFVSLLKDIRQKVKIVYVMVDHNRQSIGRNAEIEEISKNVDLVMAHSVNGAYAKFLIEHNIKVPFKYCINPYDFDGMRAKYWKPVEDVNLKSMKFIGRSAAWKGPALYISLSREMIKKGFISTMEGMEFSLNSLGYLFKNGCRKDGFVDNLVDTYYKDSDFSKLNSDNIYLYGPYNYKECMERLCRTGFGSDLFHLEPHMYGEIVEYCMLDSICCGTIPILHKHYGDNTKAHTGGHLTDYDNGVVWVDDNNITEAAELMNKLANDPKLFDEYREKSFAFFKTQCDYSVATEYMVNIFNELKNGTIESDQKPRTGFGFGFRLNK